MNNLVLSIFPGIDLLGRAFEEEGYCVVRGPDLLWGGNIKTFHPPAGVFEGVIGGPPCQFASRLRHLNPLAGAKQGNLIPEFERVVAEARPSWWLMENVREAPEPKVTGYKVHYLMLNNRWLGAVQHRVRRFSFGTASGVILDVEVALFESPRSELAVTSSASKVPVRIGGSGKVKASLKPVTVLAGHGPVGRGRGYENQITLAEACELQGLPVGFLDDSPFTVHGKRQVIGNSVPLPMGSAIAKAVRKAIEKGQAP